MPAALCAVTGTVRGIIDPAGGVLSPSLQIVAHGKSHIILQRALREFLAKQGLWPPPRPMPPME